MIYAASKAIKHKVEWMKESEDSEWLYFGEGNHLNKALIIETIQSHIPEQTIYIVVTRKNSFTISQKELWNAIADLFETQNFLIWNSGFTKVIECNQIGVLRRGITANIKH